ncbi:uncharacterized protein [Lolium perenne]|uniref:uncharacterized protein n=1 Tax=Lolium perenne TaxID=4522 RepID=UPI0021F5286D|nr:RING-H2 finger protein ATL46-like [Lolium perenne]
MARLLRDRAPAAFAWPPEDPSVPSLPQPRPPPSPPSENDQPPSQGGVVAGLVIGFLALLLLGAVVYSLCKGRRQSRALAHAQARAAAWAAARLRQQAEPRTREDDQRRQHLRRASGPGLTTARLPAFSYNQSLKQNVAGTGEDAATCSVCLGAFQNGESVRLLPACLHLFHIECIDPWLDAHSTCPICRSDTDPTVDVAARLSTV